MGEEDSSQSIGLSLQAGESDLDLRRGQGINQGIFEQRALREL